MSGPTMTSALVLVGSDIKKSPSPAMHNAALIALGRPERYGLCEVSDEDVGARFASAPKRFLGMNVTAPYKTLAAEHFAPVLDEETRAIGVVNTVCFSDGAARCATNTDVHGLREAWRRGAVHIEGRDAVVIGTGATAKSAIYALADVGATSVCVLGRRPAAVAHLLNFATGLGLHAHPEPAADAYLAIIATTALDAPSEWIARALRRKGVVHDVRYRDHLDARNAALVAGHFFIDGRTMLVAQAARALTLFLGIAHDPVIPAAMAAALQIPRPAEP